MAGLIIDELCKVWKRKAFLVSMAVLFAGNLFLLWYQNIPAEEEPPLSAYRAFSEDIDGMSEEEKNRYVEQLYEKINNIGVVFEFVSYQNLTEEMRGRYTDMLENKYPGIVEQYYDEAMRGDYLRYTASYDMERQFIEEQYRELKKVSGYQTFLEEVAEQTGILSGISIFRTGNGDSFSERNIKKEAEDYGKISGVTTEFYPSRGVVTAAENTASDLILFAAVLLFATAIIMEEKERGMFGVIRACSGGRGRCIFAKLSALLIHSVSIVVIICGSNLVFAACTLGIGNPFRSIQSVAPYMETAFQITVMDYILLSWMTKALLLFGLGALLLFIAMKARYVFWIYLTGVLLLGTGVLCYRLIPAWSSWSWLKYLNLFALFKTEMIYGRYLNLNLAGVPVARALCQMIAVITVVILSAAVSVVSFVRTSPAEKRVSHLRFSFSRHMARTPMGHESYKILIMNRAAFLLALVAAAVGCRRLSTDYQLSSAETYYKSLMLSLEGELTEEKKELYDREQARYDAAFAGLEEVERLLAEESIGEEQADMMKLPHYQVLAFYPAFERVERQMAWLNAHGGSFVYDTGYRYLFGVGDDAMTEYILFMLGLLLAFGNVIACEYRYGTPRLLACTAVGKKRIWEAKVKLCTSATAVAFLFVWMFRLIAVQKSFPLHEWGSALRQVTGFESFGLNIPIWAGVLLLFLVQLAVLGITALCILFLSAVLKNYPAVLFLGSLLFVLPVVLYILGFAPAKYCSLYCIYNIFAA